MTRITQGYVLRRLRIVVALAVWAVLTWSLVTFASAVPDTARWLESIQFLPAAMAFSLSTVAGWVGVTLVFGRLYCSTVCPLGTLQDAFARLPRLSARGRRRNHYHYSRPLTTWRTVTLTAVVIAVFLGVTLVTTLLDPWSIYSRACTYILRPAWGWICNLLAPLTHSPAVVISLASTAGIVSAALIIAGIGWLAARNGRTFCNSVCPVGTALGCVSRYSILHIDINTDLCTQCRRCEHVCKASCIDLVSHVVDGSRCVGCFDCIDVCPDDAIRYTTARHTPADPLMQLV